RRLNDLEAMLVQDGERALDPFVGGPVRGLVAEPRCVAEQQGRNNQGADQAEPQESDGRFPVALHCPGSRGRRIIARWNSATPRERRTGSNRYNGIGSRTSQTGLAWQPFRFQRAP